MTIEKAIAEVQQQKLDYQEFWEEYKNEHIEALDIAIDTMRKYQKIADLYDYWRSDKCEYTISCMENIGKVLRGRNDD